MSVVSIDTSLSARLGEISGQIKEFIHKIAESRKCSLQSLELELHMGELKVRERGGGGGGGEGVGRGVWRVCESV